MKKRKCIMKNMETGAEDKNQQTAIYVMTHKAFTPPPDPLYIPCLLYTSPSPRD